LSGRGNPAVGASRAGQPTGAEELRLLGRVREGDRRAFEELYRIYHPRLMRFLINLVRRPQLVEEVLNDTLMVVWERSHSFKGASKLSTWIFAIAYRKAMKAVRRRDEPVEDRQAEQRPSPDDGPEEAVAHQRKQALLVRAIDELSPEHRAVVDLTYFHDMEYREIASILSCPVDTVKTRMFHARRRLRRRMEGELADWL
jgi:RNA polymerase sigma factor (sigma-70 family)